jgi:hypothetical protein
MNREKAMGILPYVGIVERKDNKPYKLYTPASPVWTDKKRGAFRYACVTLNRNGTTVAASCEQVTGQDREPCPAPIGGNVCYHILAALIVTANDSGADLEAYSTEASAKQRAGANGWTLTVRAGKALAYAALIPRTTKQSKSKEAEQPKRPAFLAEKKQEQPKAACKCGAPLPTIEEEANQECIDCTRKAFGTSKPATVAPLSLFPDASHNPPEPKQRRTRKRAKVGS